MGKLVESEIVIIVHKSGISGIDLCKSFRWCFGVDIVGKTRSCTCMSSCIIRRVCRCRRWWHLTVLRDFGAILPLLIGGRVLLYVCRRSLYRRTTWRLWLRSVFTTRLCPQLLYDCSLAFLWASLLADGVKRAVQVIALAAVAWPTIVASYFSPSTGIAR